MIKNYIKTGWRNLVKSKLFSLINITGMSISIASFLLIALFVWDELKFDKHIEDRSLKFRIYNDEFSDDGGSRKLSMVPPVIGPALTAEYPEVERYARILNITSSLLFEAGDIKLIETRGGYADPSIFEMFSLSLKEGDPATALRDANTVAISASTAKKYFGERSALGESLQINNENAMVAAVYYDFPVHSHLQMDYMLAMQGLVNAIPERMEKWGWRQFHTYIRVREGTPIPDLGSKIEEFAIRKAWPETKPGGSWYIPRLMPLEKVHLDAGDQQWDLAVRGNAQTVYILSGTAIFILIIAILNFINLSTARAVNRVKEVGVRKVIGALRKQLVYQFISESVIIAVIALFLGVVILEMVLPLLNTFTGKSIPVALFFYNPLLVGGGIAFAILIGVAAGAYPAFYVSGFRPVQILANRQSPMSGKALLRKGLVIVQFVLSFFLIIASLVIADQHRYMRTKDMGFDKDNLLVIPLRDEMRTNPDATKNSFLNHPNVVSATMGYGLPGQAFAGDGILDVRSNKRWSISLLTVDHDYIKTLCAHVVAGRDFSLDRPSDEHDAFIISEKAVQMLGYSDPADAIGHEIAWDRWDQPDSLKSGKVIGVVRDFHLNSLKEDITPIAIHIFPYAYNTITLRVKGTDLDATITHISETYKRFNTEWPLEYKFLDDNFDRLYKSEEKLAMLFTVFTGLSIFVACFGLFGLVVFSTTQRYREISIRKVLGAREVSLVLGLTKNYLALIAIAFTIAIPLSWYFAQSWLENFSFRIDITAGMFIKAGVFIVFLSLITIGIQALKAARANPVNALKES